MNYKIISKFVKDLKFKIPSAKSFFLLSKNISNYKINIDIKSEQIKEKLLEVQTTLSLLPKDNKIEKIETKVIYSSIIELDKKIDNKKDIERIILVDVPTKIYPELRRIFVFIFESSGFRDIKISEAIDFQKLYNLKKVQ